MLFYLEKGPLSHLILIVNFLVADQLAVVKWQEFGTFPVFKTTCNLEEVV